MSDVTNLNIHVVQMRWQVNAVSKTDSSNLNPYPFDWSNLIGIPLSNTQSAKFRFQDGDWNLSYYHNYSDRSHMLKLQKISPVCRSSSPFVISVQVENRETGRIVPELSEKRHFTRFDFEGVVWKKFHGNAALQSQQSSRNDFKLRFLVVLEKADDIAGTGVGLGGYGQELGEGSSARSVHVYPGMGPGGLFCHGQGLGEGSNARSVPVNPGMGPFGLFGHGQGLGEGSSARSVPVNPGMGPRGLFCHGQGLGEGSSARSVPVNPRMRPGGLFCHGQGLGEGSSARSVPVNPGMGSGGLFGHGQGLGAGSWWPEAGVGLGIGPGGQGGHGLGAGSRAGAGSDAAAGARSVAETGSFQGIRASIASTWECNTCFIRNPETKAKCMACDDPRRSKDSSSKGAGPGSGTGAGAGAGVGSGTGTGTGESIGPTILDLISKYQPNYHSPNPLLAGRDSSVSTSGAGSRAGAGAGVASGTGTGSGQSIGPTILDLMSMYLPNYHSPNPSLEGCDGSVSTSGAGSGAGVGSGTGTGSGQSIGPTTQDLISKYQPNYHSPNPLLGGRDGSVSTSGAGSGTGTGAGVGSGTGTGQIIVPTILDLISMHQPNYHSPNPLLGGSDGSVSNSGAGSGAGAGAGVRTGTGTGSGQSIGPTTQDLISKYQPNYPSPNPSLGGRDGSVSTSGLGSGAGAGAGVRSGTGTGSGESIGRTTQDLISKYQPNYHSPNPLLGGCGSVSTSGAGSGAGAGAGVRSGTGSGEIIRRPIQDFISMYLPNYHSPNPSLEGCDGSVSTSGAGSGAGTDTDDSLTGPDYFLVGTDDSLTGTDDSLTGTDDFEVIDRNDVEEIDTNDVEVTDTNDVEATDTNDVEATDTNDCEATDTNDCEAADTNDAGATDTNDVEATDTNDFEVIDTNDVEVIDANDVKLADTNDAKVTDTNDAKVTDTNDADVTDTDEVAGQSTGAGSIPVQTTLPLKVTPCLEKLSEDFANLMLKGANYDVKFLCAGRSVKAHKLIVCSRSPVIAAMLKNDGVEGRASVVPISNIEPDVLTQFVRYMYCGQLEELTFEVTLSLYEAGHQYKVPSLTQRCSEFLLEHLSTGNACKVLVLAEAHKYGDFLEKVIAYILKNKVLLASESWSDLCINHPLLANKVFKHGFGISY